MSEELSAAAAAPEADRTPGALLKRERERRSISVQQAAEDLHLDPWIIEAIEANRFQALGAPVYAKGHLRKYATKLGLSVQEVFDRYEALNDRPVEPDPIPTAIATPPVQPRRASKTPIWIVIGIVVVALVGWAVYAWLSGARLWPVTSVEIPSQSTVQPTVAASSESSTYTSSESASLAPAFSTPPTSGASETAVTTQPAQMTQTQLPAPSESAPPAAAMPAPAAQSSVPAARPPAASTDAVRIRLEFAGDSWTEVYDARGERLMFDIGSAGRVRNLSGEPPLRVVLGDASVVALQVNGAAVAIPERPGRESTRFVIEADGTVR